ncbi:unnamed protein product [Brachionus calyciflorus]|uniref:1-acyl-sn-glycerol-3-phosphate acyltransferase n=1 Tax=Brachionus calyciflorus TaxID=104777 RepID=A0A813S2B4_9BILA|nr:unnamed protein product [Brachionus calyciflorus]
MSSDSLPTTDELNPNDCTCCFTTGLSVFLSIWIVLFYAKTPLQFYIKYATYALTVIFFALIVMFLCLLRPCNPKNVAIVAKIFNILFKIYDIDYEIENAKYLQIKDPYILICNHQSSMDFMTMMKIWPGGNCTPLAKKELLYSGPFGIAAWLCGITFIDRINPQKARGTLEKLADKINDDNMRIWIYPEGTRSPSTQLLPFKKGAFHLAIQAQVPIVCVVTSSYSNFYNKKEKKFNFVGKVKVRVLPPFQTTGMDSDSVNQLSKHLQDKMQKEFDLLNKEIGLDEKYYVKSKNDKVDNDLTRTTFVQDLDYTQLNDLTHLNSLINQTDSIYLSQVQSDSNNNSINEEDQKKSQ